MSEKTIECPDSQYWDNADELPGEKTGPFLKSEESGVVIGAPKQVALDLRKTLPVLAVRFCETKEEWAVPFDRHALLAAINLGDNRVYAGYAADQEVELPEVDPADAPDGRSSSGIMIDARERISLPWRAGRYLLTLVMRDVVSNRVPVELGASDHSYRDEEVAKFLAAEAAKLGPPTVSPAPGNPLPSYQKRDDSPPLPKEPGIRMVADRVVVIRQDASCLLRGAFRLTPLAREVVKPVPKPAGAAPPPDPQPTAVIRITLLITGSAVPTPALYRLDVPSYDPIVSDAPVPAVTGYFTLDLLARGMIAKVPQTSFIYAFSGEFLEGPIPVAVITEDMLPR